MPSHYRNNLFIGTNHPDKPVLGSMRAFNLTGEGSQNFRTLAEFQRATGQEAHGVVVDYDIFKNVRPPDPTQPHKVYVIGDMDFSLKPNGAAVDAGIRLPNLNDDFSVKAPDLGAIELGKPQPIYGARK